MGKYESYLYHSALHWIELTTSFAQSVLQTTPHVTPKKIMYETEHCKMLLKDE